MGIIIVIMWNVYLVYPWQFGIVLLVKAKMQLGFIYAPISIELPSFFVYNHNSWVLASTMDECTCSLLPHSAHLEILAQLKFLQISACKIGHEVA